MDQTTLDHTHSWRQESVDSLSSSLTRQPRISSAACCSLLGFFLYPILIAHSRLLGCRPQTRRGGGREIGQRHGKSKKSCILLRSICLSIFLSQHAVTFDISAVCKWDDEGTCGQVRLISFVSLLGSKHASPIFFPRVGYVVTLPHRFLFCISCISFLGRCLSPTACLFRRRSSMNAPATNCCPFNSQDPRPAVARSSEPFPGDLLPSISPMVETLGSCSGTLTTTPNPRMDARHTALSMPEILQEICRYLDNSALVQASRISKQFWACCTPLLWMTVPVHAWDNDHFCTNWQRHGSRILVLHCAAHVDLGLISTHCQNLVSLDVSRVQGYMTTMEDQVCMSTKVSGKHSFWQNSNGDQISKTIKEPGACTYGSFLRMTEELIKVLDSNRKLKCLQMKPHGRFPPRLLSTISRMKELKILSLNAWHDFQEYSLQMIIESCSKLSHLSLGENDFTRFTLEKLCDPPAFHTHVASNNVVLDQLDYSAGGQNRAAMLDQEPYRGYSKRDVPDTLSPTLDSHSPRQSQIRSLSLHQTGLRQDFLVNITRRCPRLEHLSMLDGWGFYPSSGFAQTLSQICPGLTRLEFREQALDLQDEFFTSLCQHFPQLQWIHAGMTGFSRGAIEAVRSHCRNIVSLNLDGARGVPSQSMDQILRTCSTLIVFSARGVVLNGRDLSHESRWSCRRLETLVLDVEIYSTAGSASGTAHSNLEQHCCEVQESVSIVRKRVYDQLAELARLKVLGLGGGHRVGGMESGVDMTLTSGLERLESLHCLERLDIRRMVRTQSEEDFAWMVRNWPRFRYLEISKSRAYTRVDDKTHKAIEWLSRSRPGMTLRLH